MCERGSHVALFINDHWGGRFWNIDRCLAPLVQMLLELGVKVTQACCGHGERPIRITFPSGQENMAIDIVRKLNPASIVPPPGMILASWPQLPEKEMHGMGMHYYGDGSVAGRECVTMFIDEGGHPTWWHDIPVNVFPLVQMLRELGVHTTNFHARPDPEEICLWFSRGKDNSAYKIVKRLSPDELTPPEHSGNHVAVWKKSPIPRLLAEQGEIRGYS